MPRKNINLPPESETQEWANLGVAVPREMKLDIGRRAAARGLKVSQYARTLLIDGMRREDQAA